MRIVYRPDRIWTRLFRHVTTTRAAVALIAIGAAARLTALGLAWGTTLDPDAQQYIALARKYTFSSPWSASFREPLWRGIVKAAIAPFGYSPDAARCLTTAISIATLPVAWFVLRGLARRWSLHERVAVIALAVVAGSQQLIRDAPRGLREDTCLLLFLLAVYPLLAANRSRRAALGIGLTIGALSAIRFELATLLLAVALLAAVVRRISPLAPVLAVLGVVLFAGPWLWANKERHGSLFWNTKVHSSFYWRQEQPLSVQARYQGGSLTSDPQVSLSWKQYYLDYLGPKKAAKRFVLGYPRLIAKLVASQPVPRAAARGTLGANQGSRGWLLVIAALTGVFALAVAAAGRQIWRRRRSVPLFASAFVVFLICLAPYAAIAQIIELRVVMFTVPLLALLFGCAVDACLPEPARVRRQLPSRARATAPVSAEPA